MGEKLSLLRLRALHPPPSVSSRSLETAATRQGTSSLLQVNASYLPVWCFIRISAIDNGVAQFIINWALSIDIGVKCVFVCVCMCVCVYVCVFVCVCVCVCVCVYACIYVSMFHWTRCAGAKQHQSTADQYCRVASNQLHLHFTFV